MLETVFDEMKTDWASIREDEVGSSDFQNCTFLVVNIYIYIYIYQDTQVIQLAENSLCCGMVYEVDVFGLANHNRSCSLKVIFQHCESTEVCINFKLCLHILAKYGLAIPYPKIFEAFLCSSA